MAVVTADPTGAIAPAIFKIFENENNVVGGTSAISDDVIDIVPDALLTSGTSFIVEQIENSLASKLFSGVVATNTAITEGKKRQNINAYDDVVFQLLNAVGAPTKSRNGQELIRVADETYKFVAQNAQYFLGSYYYVMGCFGTPTVYGPTLWEFDTAFYEGGKTTETIDSLVKEFDTAKREWIRVSTITGNPSSKHFREVLNNRDAHLYEEIIEAYKEAVEIPINL